MGGIVRRSLTNLSLALLSVLFAMLLFEIAARRFVGAWAPPAGDRQFWLHDHQLGWRHVPDQRGRHVHRDFRVEVAINSRGLRDDEHPLERVEGRCRMLLLGDSFGWGFGVEKHEMLSELLESRRPDWEVINASVSGYGTDQQLLWVRQEGLAYQPDVVLLLFHPNDFLDNHTDSRYGYRKPLFVVEDGELVLTRVPVPRRSTRARVERWLYLNSYLYPRLLRLRELATEALEGWLARMPEPEPDPEPGPEPDRKPSWQDRLHRESGNIPITRHLLRALDSDVKEAGARFVVVSAPMAPHLREILAEILRGIGVDHLALDPVFAAQPRDELHFAHDPHWNAAGHRAAAEATETFLARRGYFARECR